MTTADFRAHGRLLAVGSWEFLPAKGQSWSAIQYRCPCGCGDLGILPIAGRSHLYPQWDWDGNPSRPTLTQRINRVCGWQGYLTMGVFVK